MRNKKKHRTIVFDADGVVFEYDHWRGADHVGKVDEKANVLIRFLEYLGYDVAVSTARSELGPMIAKAHNAGLPVDEITNRKPVGIAYVDDRGVHHTWGMWKETIEKLAEVVGDPEILEALEVVGE